MHKRYSVLLKTTMVQECIFCFSKMTGAFFFFFRENMLFTV